MCSALVLSGLLELANDLRNRNLHDDAEYAFRLILREWPGTAPAHAGLAYNFLGQGDRTGARDEFAAALALHQNEPGWPLDAADNLRAMELWDEAAAAYQHIEETEPGNGRACAGLGYVARGRGEMEAARGYFEQAAQAEPENYWLALDMADHLSTMDRPGEAEGYYRLALEREPDLGRAHAGLAYMALKQGKRKLAQSCFAAALSLPPVATDLQLDAADNLRALGRLDDAETIYRLIIAAHPGLGRAHAGLGYVLRAQDRMAAAQDCFEAAVQSDPANHWLQLDAADNLRAAGRAVDAEARYRAVLAAHPGNSRALAGTGNALRQRGALQEAQLCLEEAAQAEPENHWLRLDLGDNLRELGRLGEAEAIYREALDALPGHGHIHANLGLLERARGDRQAAQLQFAEAVRLEPGNMWFHLELAFELREDGNFAEARRIGAATAEAFAEHVEPLLSLADTEIEAGDDAAAASWLRRADSAFPPNPDVLTKLAMVESRLGDQAKADEHLAAALRQNPVHAPAIRRLAAQYMTAQKPLAALELYQGAAALQPAEPAFRLGMIDALAAAGAFEDALGAIDEWRATQGDLPELLLKRVATLRRIGCHREAMQTARQGTALAPRNFWLWLERFQAERLLSDDATLDQLLDDTPTASQRERAVLARSRGALAEQRWQYEAAIGHYLAGAALAPDDSGIEFDLVRSYMLAFDLAEARKHLARYRDLEAPNIRLRRGALNLSQSLFGQLLDEYRMNEMPPQVAPLLGLALPERIAALGALMQERPGNTAAALNLILALRHAGQLGRMGEPGNATIPKIILQFWDGADVPDDITAYRATWQAMNPDYELRQFNAETALDFIAAHYPAPVVQAYRRTREPAQKADLFRLAYLYIEGGVYADADDRATGPLAAVLGEGVALALYHENLGTLGNNFMAATPGHPLTLKALQAAVLAINRGDADIVWLSTGPGLITRSFALLFADSMDKLPGVTRILDLRELHQAVSIHCEAGYKVTGRHWSNAILRQNAANVAAVPAGEDDATEP